MSSDEIDHQLQSRVKRRCKTTMYRFVLCLIVYRSSLYCVCLLFTFVLYVEGSTLVQALPFSATLSLIDDITVIPLFCLTYFGPKNLGHLDSMEWNGGLE